MIKYVIEKKRQEKTLFLVFDSCINLCNFSVYHYDHNCPFWVSCWGGKGLEKTLFQYELGMEYCT